MSNNPTFSLVKPSIKTKFHIDFDWWKNHDNNWHVFLFSYLCPDHQSMFKDESLDAKIDWVDPETAEVFQVDGIQSILMNHCAKVDNFLTDNTALVDGVFRVFLANGNNPLDASELSDRIGKPAETILRTISSGAQIYRGIRPCR